MPGAEQSMQSGKYLGDLRHELLDGERFGQDGVDAGVRFAWSGSTVEARFTGPSIAMRLRAAALETPRGGPDAPATTTAYAVQLDDRPQGVGLVDADDVEQRRVLEGDRCDDDAGDAAPAHAVTGEA